MEFMTQGDVSVISEEFDDSSQNESQSKIDSDPSFIEYRSNMIKRDMLRTKLADQVPAAQETERIGNLKMTVRTLTKKSNLVTAESKRYRSLLKKPTNVMF
jgi:hypothetical protein